VTFLKDKDNACSRGHSMQRVRAMRARGAHPHFMHKAASELMPATEHNIVARSNATS